MVGGKIVDWYRREDGAVEFLARGTGGEKGDFCCVTAKIPERVVREIQEGDNIWWQSDALLLTVFGVQDVQFKKIGAAGGGVREFYQRHL